MEMLLLLLCCVAHCARAVASLLPYAALCMYHAFTVLTADRAPAVAQQQQQNAPTSSTPPADAFTTIKQLRLRSAAAYLPHPEKESYGGEDAHFVSNVSGGAIGVADGAYVCCGGVGWVYGAQESKLPLLSRQLIEQLLLLVPASGAATTTLCSSSRRSVP